MRKKKILFAVGGTGGHLFPAQALARQLKEEHGDIDILFGGGRLASNPYFHQMLFPYREIQSSSPFRSNPLKAAYLLNRGVRQSLQLFKDFSPDLLIGFGSFYSFPLLAAARLKKIDYLLVETNAHPGKVNRLFSKKSLTNAIQFEEAEQILKGTSTKAKMPFWADEKTPLSKEEAREYFQLDKDLFTILVFGGSQGAEAINNAASSLNLDFPYQVIHLSGKVSALKEKYDEKKIPACVKPFESQMHYAFRAADLAICRSGSGTLSELVDFEVPSILVPWPYASEDHQTKNAQVLQKAGGARILQENQLDELGSEIEKTKKGLEQMRDALTQFKKSMNVESLSSVVLQHIGRGK